MRGRATILDPILAIAGLFGIALLFALLPEIVR